MSTHRVTLDLPSATFQALQRMVGNGTYENECDAALGVLDELTFPEASLPPSNGRTHDEWVREEAREAFAAYQANPADLYTSAEVKSLLHQDNLSSDTKGLPTT